MQSCIYEGTVRHRRYAPFLHSFQYSVSMMYIDLAELPRLFQPYLLWSAERAAIARWKRSDFLGDPEIPLDEAVRRRVEEKTGVRPSGPIRMLTHLRYFGYSFNPVTFYFCFDNSGAVDSVVAEITNTPWLERHSYVLPASESTGGSRSLRFQFEKAFHISPFMDMDHSYDWRFTPPGRSMVVHMENLRGGERLFDATLVVRRREISSANLSRVLFRYPAMSLQVVSQIYWQAFLLWWKRCPYFVHPRFRTDAAVEEKAR